MDEIAFLGAARWVSWLGGVGGPLDFCYNRGRWRAQFHSVRKFEILENDVPRFHDRPFFKVPETIAVAIAEVG